MQIISGIVDGKEVIILYEHDDKPCYLYVRLMEPFNIIRKDDIFPNAMKLSAFLACELCCGPARDFLHDHAVPQKSLLWHLNHSGWAPDMRKKEKSTDA